MNWFYHCPHRTATTAPPQWLSVHRPMADVSNETMKWRTRNSLIRICHNFLKNINICPRHPDSGENRKFERGVKEVIYIRVVELSLNKDDWCYLHQAVWTYLLRARVWALPPVPGPRLMSRSPLRSITSLLSQLNLRKTTEMVERFAKQNPVFLSYK